MLFIYGNFQSGLWVGFRGGFVVFNVPGKHVVLLLYEYVTIRCLGAISSMYQLTSHLDMVLLIWTS